jgi:serine/threonine protein kinase
VQQEPPSTKNLTIHVPLGRTAVTAVYLVRREGPSPRLLRLKIWRRTAGVQFLSRFHHLQKELEAWSAEDVDRPLAASLDAAGCPSVLTEFRQGLPIVDRVRSGRLDPDQAIALLKPITALIAQAHTRGLVHGSIVAGNVIVDAESGRARLLDFGLTPLLGPEEGLPRRAADFLAIEALTDSLRTLGIH